jgi:hypothetical protein
MKRNIVLHFLISLLVAAMAPAQDEIDPKKLDKTIPPFKLATKVDAKGLQQWEAFPVHNCPACKGAKQEECLHCKHIETPTLCPECALTRKAPCHHCAGAGKLADPLEFAPCPGCNSHGIMICFMCGNRGRLNASAEYKGIKCMSCKEESGMDCTVCKGKRLVKSALKGKIGKANLKQLQKAKATARELMTAVVRYRATGVGRVDRKTFDALFKHAKSDFPELKDVSGLVKNLVRGVDQPQYKDNDKRIIAVFDRLRTNVVLYLIHQERVLDQCIARAEFNEKAGNKKQP